VDKSLKQKAKAKKELRVAIVSDQAVYLRGLETILLSVAGIRLVGEARSSSEAQQLCLLTKPELLMIHLPAAYGDRLELAKEICRQSPDISVVLLMNSSAEHWPEEGPDENGLYYLDQDVSEEEFSAALSQVWRDRETLKEGGATRLSLFRHKVDDEDFDSSGVLGHMAPIARSEELLTRELAMAGKIQATILPEEPPVIPGWDISAILLPARETSGDFYDFIPMAYQKWGLVVADVTDKGMGAALFMALSSTLIRTYASRYPTLPALTMNAVNERILSDTRGSMFVTVLFGILEPHTGRFVFSNAGHPPGFLIGGLNNKLSIQQLRPTGMVLGVSEQASWKQKSVKLAPGDFLVLYTDGITEAANARGEFYGEEKLLDVALSMAGKPAKAIQEALVESVQRFVGTSVRQDDIALVVVRREN
jgi:serine phosphatase RsbU (regulator of sigma subunit)